MSLLTVLIVEAVLLAFFVLGYVLWRRNRAADRSAARAEPRD